MEGINQNTDTSPVEQSTLAVTAESAVSQQNQADSLVNENVWVVPFASMSKEEAFASTGAQATRSVNQFRENENAKIANENTLRDREVSEETRPIREEIAEELAEEREAAAVELARNDAEMTEKYGARENWPLPAQKDEKIKNLGWGALGVAVLSVAGGMLGSSEAHAGKFDIGMYLKQAGFSGTAVEKVGKVFQKGQQYEQVNQQIKGVEANISSNNLEIQKLQGENMRAQQVLDIQARGENKQVGGEISAQNKVNTAQEKAQVREMEGQIKIENARYSMMNAPTPVDEANHELAVSRFQSQIDIIVANAQATHIRQDGVVGGAATAGEFRGVDVARRIQDNNNGMQRLADANKVLEQQLHQLRLQQGGGIFK